MVLAGRTNKIMYRWSTPHSGSINISNIHFVTLYNCSSIQIESIPKGAVYEQYFCTTIVPLPPPPPPPPTHTHTHTHTINRMWWPQAKNMLTLDLVYILCIVDFHGTRTSGCQPQLNRGLYNSNCTHSFALRIMHVLGNGHVQLANSPLYYIC